MPSVSGSTSTIAVTCILAAAIVAVAEPAASADAQEPLAHYRAYEKALDAGDLASAAREARAAWEAAEQELGDHRVSAVLAYNYGTLVAFEEPVSARDALLRAHQLQEEGLAELEEAELRLYLAFTEFAVSGYERREANRLRKALEAVEEQESGPVADRSAMWLRLASQDVADGQYRKALKSAAAAEAAVRSEVPDDYRSLAHTILIGGVARLVPAPRNEKTVQAAHNEFVRAQRLFPPQSDLDNFDPLLAQVLAWDAAADAALVTLGRDNYRDHQGARQKESPPVPETFAYQQESGIDCQPVEWAEREPPRFPSRELRRGSIGAVFVGYRLGDDLRVRDARVLAEVPVEAFGDAALSAMSDWRASELPAGGPECYRNLLTQFTFALKH